MGHPKGRRGERRSSLGPKRLTHTALFESFVELGGSPFESKKKKNKKKKKHLTKTRGKEGGRKLFQREGEMRGGQKTNGWVRRKNMTSNGWQVQTGERQRGVCLFNRRK